MSQFQSRDVPALYICEAWRDESEFVKTMYSVEDAFLISSLALMISQISAINRDGESDRIMEITESDGKTAAYAT